MTSKIVTGNGTVIQGIKSCVYTETVNAGEGLVPGCVASACIEVVVFGSQSDAPTSGEALTYYQVDSNGTETLIGVFYAEPSVPTKNTYRFVAYDAVSKLDVSFATRLNAIQNNFPMTIYDLVSEACSVAGVTLGSASWPLSTQTVEAFYADVTCRNILQYAAELAGRFVRCDTSGSVVFDWYTTNSTYTIHPGATQAGEIAYKQDGLTYDNFTVLAVDAVAIRPSGTEGAAYIYPASYEAVTAEDSDGNGNIILTNLTVTDDGNGNLYLSVEATDDSYANVTISDTVAVSNTFIIADNLLLTNATSEIYNAAAQNIYEVMHALPGYRHATIQLFKNENPFRAGEFVSVTDAQGVSFLTPVFEMSVQESCAQLRSSGNETYATESSSVDKALKNLASNIVQIEKLKVGWADIQEAIIQYLKLYGLMTVFTDSTLSTIAGKLGWTTGNTDMPVSAGMILASEKLGGISIVSDNGAYMAFKASTDWLETLHLDGGGSVDIQYRDYGRKVGLDENGITIRGGMRWEGINDGDIYVAMGTDINTASPQGDVNIDPAAKGDVKVCGFTLASSNQYMESNDYEEGGITILTGEYTFHEKLTRNWVYPSEMGSLSSLATSARSSLVDAINELEAGLEAATTCVTSTGDINDIIAPGMYYMASGATNLPEGTNGLLVVYRLSSLYVKQIFQRMGTPGTNDGNIYTRTSNNGGSTWGSWATHYAAYRAGNTLSGTFGVHGFITNSGTGAYVEIPLMRPYEAGATVTCTAATLAQLRSSDGGYVGGANADLTSYIVSVGRQPNGLVLRLDNSSGWGITNNTPFSGLITLTLVFS